MAHEKKKPLPPPKNLYTLTHYFYNTGEFFFFIFPGQKVLENNISKYFLNILLNIILPSPLLTPGCHLNKLESIPIDDVIIKFKF